MSYTARHLRDHRLETSGPFAHHPTSGVVLAIVGWLIFGLITLDLFLSGARLWVR
jgi:hypothetical protein